MMDRTEFRFFCDVCGKIHKGSREPWSPHYLKPGNPICLFHDLVHNILNQKEPDETVSACPEGVNSCNSLNKDSRIGISFTGEYSKEPSTMNDLWEHSSVLNLTVIDNPSSHN